MAKLISKTYGEAIFELAVSENKVDTFLEEIRMILSVLKENPKFSDIMNHPKIIKEEKLQVIDEVFGGRISDELTGFIRLIVTKGRYSNIFEIMQYFLDQVKEFFKQKLGASRVTGKVIFLFPDGRPKAFQDLRTGSSKLVHIILGDPKNDPPIEL